MGVGFGLLGGVEVRIEGRLVDVGHARQRCVLAVLLAEANHVVSVDQLVDRVWGERASTRARETLYNYVSRLRHALGATSEATLSRQTGGYVLRLDPMAVDMHRFDHLIGQARASDDQEQAVGLFEQALGLWRGEPCAGLDTPWITALRDRLERDRFAAELDCTDLRLGLGHHGRLLSELTARTQAHPVDERVAEQLMLALYQSGRQADALDHFQQLRARLAEELGIDPSPALRRLHEQILTTDPALTTPTIKRAPASRLPVPRQLPAHTPHFVGRAAKLGQLAGLLATTMAGARW